jgi:hypothetical protein
LVITVKSFFAFLKSKRSSQGEEDLAAFLINWWQAYGFRKKADSSYLSSKGCAYCEVASYSHPSVRKCILQSNQYSCQADEFVEDKTQRLWNQ